MASVQKRKSEENCSGTLSFLTIVQNWHFLSDNRPCGASQKELLKLCPKEACYIWFLVDEIWTRLFFDWRFNSTTEQYRDLGWWYGGMHLREANSFSYIFISKKSSGKGVPERWFQKGTSSALLSFQLQGACTFLIQLRLSIALIVFRFTLQRLLLRSLRSFLMAMLTPLNLIPSTSTDSCSWVYLPSYLFFEGTMMVLRSKTRQSGSQSMWGLCESWRSPFCFQSFER